MFKTYGVEEDKNLFVRNSNCKEPLTPTQPKVAEDFELVVPYRVRKTMLKVCNSKLNIKYTISANENTIKSFIYYIGGCLSYVVLCKGYKELKIALDIHKKISKCQSLIQVEKLMSIHSDMVSAY